MTSIVNDAKGVANTFSSWDNCMSKAYCKWPVIAAIILGSIIVLSILWCLFSCLCCGISLCNACVQCLTCGGCCGACKGGGRRSRNKDTEYQPMPPTPTPYQGYQPQPSPMMYNGNTTQFARFDAPSKQNTKVNDDALPHMPSWSNATTRQVEDTSARQTHDMEMDRIKPQQQLHSNSQPQPQPQLQLQQQRSRGAYSQLPPSSPIREDYHHNHQPYASDLGAQRMQPQQVNDYDEFQDTPLSPAPTYYSTVPPAGTYRTQQSRHVASPPPQQTYYNDSIPYPSSRESTLFESQQHDYNNNNSNNQYQSYGARSTSPPSFTPGHSPYESYHHQQQQQQQQQQLQSPQNESRDLRPPSLLMVGRKPVAGSYREV